MDDILADLPRHATLLKDRAYRQVWRFEVNGKPYFLKFYPRRGGRLKRTVRGNPAMREFLRLQMLQRAQIPSPRAVSVLVGLSVNGQSGDAVISEGIEPSVPFDQYLADLKLRGEPIPRYRQLAAELIDIVARLGRARLGHGDLHLGNFLLHDGKLFLLDGYSVRTGGLKLGDVLTLGHSVSGMATTTDLLRGWRRLEQDGPLPAKNRVSPRRWRKFLERATGENLWFGRIDFGDWHGHYFKKSKFAHRWAGASALEISAQDWLNAWPRLWEQIESSQLPPLKRSLSGDVWSADVQLNGRTVSVIAKRPYKRYWYRYLTEIGRGRARRAWKKAWNLIARNVPTAWPLLMLEKRRFGYVTDSIVIFERIDGPTLGHVNLDELSEPQRDLLFRRTGRILRQIDQLGLSHFDAKSTNWIVQMDPILGPFPVLIDVDGVRSRRWIALGIERLLRSMKLHPQYTPADSLSLCLGYAPYSAIDARQSNSEEIQNSQ
jgi:tRNA A-37 threonylcarbamoyl transferase component Bud32